MQKKLSIIILTYKSLEKTVKCIDSISRYHSNLNYDIVLINNDPNQAEEIIKLYWANWQIKIIEPWYNTYFAWWVNIWIKNATWDYIAFINDDAYFVDDSLKKMVDFLDKNDSYFAVTWNIYNDNKEKTLSITATKLPWVLAEISRNTFIGRLFKIFNFFPKYYTEYQMLDWNREKYDNDIEAWCDAFIILRKNDFDKVGNYYNKLRLYYTEEDIWQKSKRLNKKIWYLHDVKIMHSWGVATKKNPSSKVLAITISDRFWYFYRYEGLFTALVISILSIIWNPYILFRIFWIFYWLLKLKNEKKYN